MDTKRVQNITRLISHLLKAKGKSQMLVAEEANMSYGQLNGYLKGKNDINSRFLVEILLSAGVDLEEILKSKLQKTAALGETKIETKEDILLHCFRDLKEVGQDTYLNNIVWASSVGGKSKKLPAAAKAILKESSRHV